MFVAQHAHFLGRQRQLVQQQQDGAVACALQAVAGGKVLRQLLPQRQGQGMAQLLYRRRALAAVQLRHWAGWQPALLHGKGINAVQYTPVAPARDRAQAALGLVVRTLAGADAQKRHHVLGLCLVPVAAHRQGRSR